MLKIADFGLAVVVEPGSDGVKEYAGTRGYVAPEVYDACDYEAHPGYDERCDAFSCGTIIFALLGGYLPWPTRDEERLKDALRLKRVEFADPCWGDVSTEATDLLTGLLERDPRRRTRAAKALKAPWFFMDSANLGRNTLYRCHANFSKAMDACESPGSVLRSDKSSFGHHVHEDIRRTRLESDAPRPARLVDDKGPLHAWDIKFRHGYTTFRDLDLGEALGKGAFAEVRAATNRSTGARFAVKLAPHKAGHDPNSYDPDDEGDMICDEARVLRCLCHSSVLHCYDVVVHPDKCFLVLELMEGG